jgi:glycosyltransferase involved in cell wall biosynthesis
MRVQIVDPSAFTPPYDRSLAAALTRAGVDVELVTSHFVHGPVPRPEGYEAYELFYRLATRRWPWTRGRRAVKLAEHVPDMLRFARHARAADLVHYQWLTLEPLDAWLLPRARPRVLTAHNVLSHEHRPGQAAGRRRLLRSMDAVVVHSQHGAEHAVAAGADPGRVRVIPHGAFDYLTRQRQELPLPDELAHVGRKVVLFFGLVREYKGVDVLLRAFRLVEHDAELWVVGAPRIDMTPLHELAGPRVRFVERFVPDPEIPAYFRRADLVVLPYRDIDQSGVLYTALAFGKPLVLSATGGFVELAERHGAARLVPPGDEQELAVALEDLLTSDSARAELAAAAARAAAGPCSWDTVADRTLALYRELVRA